MATLSKTAPAAHQSHAAIPVPYSAATEQFCAFAQRFGLQAETSEDRVTIRFRLGTVTLSGTAAQTQLALESETAANLQLLRDTIAERMAALDLTPDWRDKTAPGQPANMSLVTVTAVRRLTPSYTRVVIEGPDLARFADGGLHFRLLFGPEGAGWPYTDAGGVTQWPGGVRAWHRPVYTTRAIAPQADGSARIEFDIFLHDGGRVTEWSRSLTAGRQIAVTGPGGGRGPHPAPWVCLIGDETAVPVIARILQDLPIGTRGKAVLFVPEADDIQDLPHPPSLTVQWVLRGGDVTPLAALHDTDLPRSDRFVFFAAERQEALATRSYLNDSGLDKTEFHSASYWTAEPPPAL